MLIKYKHFINPLAFVNENINPDVKYCTMKNENVHIYSVSAIFDEYVDYLPVCISCKK